MESTTNSAISAAALAAAVLSGSATACAADPANVARAVLAPQISISSFSASGTGCARGGSANAVLSQSGDELQITADELIAEAGPNVPLRSYARFCSLRVQLDVPGDVSYAITKVVHRGYAKLDQGVSALQVSRYSFPGVEPAVASTSLKGPMDRTYEYEETFSSPEWSPCGSSAPLRIGLIVAISSASPGAVPEQMKAGSSDNPVSLGLSFRSCASSEP